MLRVMKIHSIIQVLIMAVFSSSALAQSYCLAVRGNGELAPAHWGAMAKVVEQKGIPMAMAGGSSASISLFLLESIAMSPIVDGAKQGDVRDNASLLLKSLQSYLELVASRPEWQEMAQMANYLKADGGKKAEFAVWLKTMIETDPQSLLTLVLQNRLKILKSLETAEALGLVDVETLKPLYAAIVTSQSASNDTQKGLAAKRVQFYAREIYSSITLLGKFNAETDQNLFFRAGIVSFKKLAVSFGHLANFYAAREMDPLGLRSLQEFAAKCAPLARGKTWDELRKINPSCDADFKKLAAAYHDSGLPKSIQSRELDRVGKFVPAFPTTAVLHSQAFHAAESAFSRYESLLDPKFGESFVVTPDNVAFGYWGPPKTLAKIQSNLKQRFTTPDGRTWDFTGDAKSSRFFALGDDSWSQVLSSSPAEPGLAPLQKLRIPLAEVYSAGGWSDLHPGAVLKAAGCDQVVYVTRRGGESLFGQGVAKRLLSFDDIPWDVLATDAARKPANKIRNNNGDPKDLTSEWSKLYNLANPSSSFNRALDVFDSVVCTDWDRFDVTVPGAVSGMIADAYTAPWVSKKTLKPQDNLIDPKLGFRPYAGCVAF